MMNIAFSDEVSLFGALEIVINAKITHTHTQTNDRLTFTTR